MLQRKSVLDITSSHVDVAYPSEISGSFISFRANLLLFLSFALVYLLIMITQLLLRTPAQNGTFHFILLANGWLHGHLYVEGTPADLTDFTFYRGHWYVAFPALPAVFFLPLVAVFHLSHPALISLCLSVAVGILNIWLMQRILIRFICLHLVNGTVSLVIWGLLLFALGSELLYTTMQGSVWFIAHVIATTFLLLYIHEVLGQRRAWLCAIFLGLASLSRSTALFTFPFFLLWIVVVERKTLLVVVRKWLIFGSVLAVFVVGMVLYNYARFGSLFDFGYNTMHVNPRVSGNLHTYSQFSLHFLPVNLRFMLLQPPILVRTFPFLTFNPSGTGIFWTMPALLFAFLAFRHREKRWLALLLLSACILPVLALLMYFNTGWYQFGYRFALDFFPFLFLLALLGMAARPSWREKLLIILTVLLNVWGYFVFAYYPPPL